MYKGSMENEIKASITEAMLALSAEEMYAEHTGNVTYLRPHEGDFYVISGDEQYAGPFSSYKEAADWSSKLRSTRCVRVCEYRHAAPHWLAS